MKGEEEKEKEREKERERENNDCVKQAERQSVTRDITVSFCSSAKSVSRENILLTQT